MSHLLSAKLISLLSMSSLVATAYILIFVPNTRLDDPKTEKPRGQLQPETGPVQKYISYLNGGLSLLIALNAIGFKDKKGVHEGFWLLCMLPISESLLSSSRDCQADDPVVSFSVIMLARRLMLSVDVGELDKLKYRYKGA